jgi:molecular chaperone DnaK
LLEETLEAIDRALSDANLQPEDLDRIILVGGSTRIPLVHQMVQEHLGQAPVEGVQPDLCVAMGAALQAGVLVGEEVESILVDVIPHSLGISAAITTPMGIMPGFFSVIIPRNSVVPVSRSEVYSTISPNQPAVEIEVFQGENEVAEENVPLGSYRVEGLPPAPAGSIQIEVLFDFDLSGILTVTTTEKGKGQQGKLVVNNAGMQRLSSHELKQARSDLQTLFEADETIEGLGSDSDLIQTLENKSLSPELTDIIERSRQLLNILEDEQAEELHELLNELAVAITDNDTTIVSDIQEELSDFLYYATSDLP